MSGKWEAEAAVHWEAAALQKAARTREWEGKRTGEVSIATKCNATTSGCKWVGLVVPMEITYLDTKDDYKKYGTLSPLRYIYSNPLRFPISSLGSPNFPSEKSLEGALAKYTANDQTLTRQ
jgi:hypothetical protein